MRYTNEELRALKELTNLRREQMGFELADGEVDEKQEDEWRDRMEFYRHLTTKLDTHIRDQESWRRRKPRKE